MVWADVRHHAPSIVVGNNRGAVFRTAFAFARPVVAECADSVLTSAPPMGASAFLAVAYAFGLHQWAAYVLFHSVLFLSAIASARWR